VLETNEFHYIHTGLTTEYIN